MKKPFLEIGKIVNTHGIRGEVKIQPWANSPDFILQFKTLYLGGKPVRILSAQVHNGNVIARLEGVDDINAAMTLKEKVLYFNREDVSLPEGKYFLEDLIGLEVRAVEDNRVLGTLTEVLTLPSGNVYAVKGEKSYLIPAVDEFIRELNPDGGYVLVHLLEGMEQ